MFAHAKMPTYSSIVTPPFAKNEDVFGDDDSFSAPHPQQTGEFDAVANMRIRVLCHLEDMRSEIKQI